MSKVWFITGTSTGFGRTLAETLLAKGETVVLTARRPEAVATLAEGYPQTALALPLDVTKPDAVRAAVRAAEAHFGRIDVLVNNAGFGVIGAVEEVSDADARRQFDTNFFGALDVLRAVLPGMRQRGGGHILNVSSIVGLAAFPGMGLYAASKFALEGASEALAAEIGPLGIHVTIVEPGAFRTEFSTAEKLGTHHAAAVGEHYRATAGGTIDWLTRTNGAQPGDPLKAAHAMIQVVESPDPPLRLLLGSDAWGMAQTKLKALTENLNAYQSVTTSTDYPTPQAA